MRVAAAPLNSRPATNARADDARRVKTPPAITAGHAFAGVPVAIALSFKASSHAPREDFLAWSNYPIPLADHKAGIAVAAHYLVV